MGGGGQGLQVASGDDVGETSVASESKKAENQSVQQATVTETLAFAFDGSSQNKILFCLGAFGGVGNGMVYPAIAWIFSNSFTDIGTAGENGLGPIKEMAFWLMGLGAYALVMSTLQTTCFEVVAYRGSQSLRLQWFHSLLRQDSAFFDVHDIGGIANSVTPAANKYRRGIGRKFGEGIQFSTCAVGGIAYSLYAQWNVALVVLAFCPVIAFFAMGVMTINQSKSARAAEAYSKAGSVAYSTVSGIKTVLSLNAVETMITRYREATEEAFKVATRPLVKQGFVNGMMLGSFLLTYIILTIYGAYNIYKDVYEIGCDPSGGITDNVTCSSTGPDVFGAFFGIVFAAQSISQVGTFLENFSAARVAAGQAIATINRKPGKAEEIVYHIEESKKDADEDDSESVSSSNLSTSDYMIETPKGKIKAILPTYEIDSMATEGLKPENTKGRLTFEDVKFSYPTRPGHTILNGLSIDVPAGKTIAFVGPSGGGKSTIVKLLERFYDPKEGYVKLDGTNIKDINVKHLRSMIGYVGQEPALFATTIGQNIAYGSPGCTQEEIIAAAKQANAHDFISQLPNGYDTNVGDKGSQLSGGQKQRIAIARVLVGDPKILLLDEATSALDSQSELVVQEALENIIKTQKRTTVIIAHRLSTIRNADTIAVVMGGAIVETGTHEELMENESYYKRLVDTQGETAMMRRQSSVTELDKFGRTQSVIGFETVPEKFLDMNTAPLIVFRNVDFSYPTRPKKTILDRFKLKIYRGETIGLCGISGGGKSTVMGLIERFYDPNEGSVEYFGEDIRKLNVKWYRDQIGYVGQEPTLFDGTIAENIAYGCPSASREEIIEAAKQANAYDFIMKFPGDFDTPISGGSGTQLSGGQKQRVAIARALVKKPEILLLDEATSALDNESERVVQEALDKLMASRERTCIVIAHRLSTIRNADRIAFIGDGRVKEIGSHDELMQKPKGKYKRLVESQGRDASTLMNGLDLSSKKKSKGKKKKDEEDELELEKRLENEVGEEELSAFSLSRARQLASKDSFYYLIGALGALIFGSIFPLWGLLFAETIELLYVPIFKCTPEILALFAFETCEDYWEFEGDKMKERSYELAGYWAGMVFACCLGSIMTYWGFGQASQRMNRRIRDDAFYALVRQEISFFDKRSVGKITSELQEDATRIQTFTGEPIRQLLISLSSVVTGLVLSLYYMWQFALLAVACIPLMGFATSLEMKQMFGEDEGVQGAEAANSPGGIIVETLLNMGTVSALTLEEERFNSFKESVNKSEENSLRDGFNQGALAGLSMFIQQWINALLFFFGGWLMTKYPEQYDFDNFLVSNFAILFALFGLGAAFQDISDRKETEQSASRIFFLLDRQSAIDPLSNEGKKLDTSKDRKLKKKKSVRKSKSKISKRSLVDDPEGKPLSSKGMTGEEGDLDEKKPKSMKKKKSKRASSKKRLVETDADDEIGEKGTVNVRATGGDAVEKPKSLKKKKSTKKKKDPDASE